MGVKLEEQPRLVTSVTIDEAGNLVCVATGWGSAPRGAGDTVPYGAFRVVRRSVGVANTDTNLDHLHRFLLRLHSRQSSPRASQNSLVPFEAAQDQPPLHWLPSRRPGLQPGAFS